jgi:tetratricopeptide (TPR) repeat protein
MSETEGNESSRHYKVMGASSTLMSLNRNEEALELLDDAIAMAIGEREIRWALAYCRQATYIAKLLKDFSKVKHYCETCLAHDPEDSWALAGLANVARRQGKIELAEEYTQRSHKALLKRCGPARIIGPSEMRDGARAKEEKSQEET